MSYCRFSSDDFRCDVYAWNDISGVYRIEVARNRIEWGDKLPPEVDYAEDPEGWIKRHSLVLKLAGELPHTMIDHELAGTGITCYDGEHFRDTMLMLKSEGFYIPDYTIDMIIEDCIEE